MHPGGEAVNIDKLMIIPQRDSIEEYMRLADEYGCGFEYNDFFTPKLLDDEEELNKCIELYNKTGNKPRFSTVHGAFFDVTVFSDDPRIMEVSELRVNQSLEVAKRLGAHAVIFHTNYIPNFRVDSYMDGWVEKNVLFWSRKLKEYPELSIYIENMFDTDCELLGRLGERMKDYSNFGICFDYAHAHVFGDEKDIDIWVRTLAPYVKHIHINDNDFDKDSHLALGDGRIDWKKFKNYYQKYLKGASVLLEVTGIEKTRQSLEYIKNL